LRQKRPCPVARKRNQTRIDAIFHGQIAEFSAIDAKLPVATQEIAMALQG
jgi:hypothetical protein